MLPTPGRGHQRPVKLPPRLPPHGGDHSGHPRAPGRGLGGVASDGAPREQEGGGVCEQSEPRGQGEALGSRWAGLMGPPALPRPPPTPQNQLGCLGRKGPLSPQAEGPQPRIPAILPSDLGALSYPICKKGFSWGSQDKNT